MPKEIERKFLVKNNGWLKNASESELLVQAYLCLDPERTIRVRHTGKHAFLTIKGKNKGLSRDEFEYKIPPEEALVLIEKYCIENPVKKRRYFVKHKNHRWEVDVFEGLNTGLVLAEVELENENEVLDLPYWVGEEVSFDIRYRNSNLASHPYCHWNKTKHPE